MLGEGAANNQFHHPTDLAFDSDGNLYVSDAWNHRVQFFALIDNQPCQALSTTTVPSSSGNPINLDFFHRLNFIFIYMFSEFFDRQVRKTKFKNDLPKYDFFL